MQIITTHLWFDKEAQEAAEFYVSAFGSGSRVLNVSQIHDTPSGSVDIVSFEIAGQPFMGINAGPRFKFNPSISFHVKNRTAEVDALWERLAAGGSVLMPLDEYPWSERYGWLLDKYGLSWQLIATAGEKIARRITPVLMFVGAVCGKAGVSWQVAPTEMDDMLQRGTKDQAARVTRAFLAMKKFDLAALRRAYEGA